MADGGLVIRGVGQREEELVNEATQTVDGGPVTQRHDAPGGHGCRWCCTWESGNFAGWGLVFVGMTRFSGDRRVWRLGSHVR